MWTRGGGRYQTAVSTIHQKIYREAWLYQIRFLLKCIFIYLFNFISPSPLPSSNALEIIQLHMILSRRSSTISTRSSKSSLLGGRRGGCGNGEEEAVINILFGDCLSWMSSPVKSVNFHKIGQSV